MVVETFYSPEEMKELGLKAFGHNVRISRKSSIYSPEKVIIGNDVRIDDFCILSGQVKLGSFIHIGAYSAIYGQSGVEMEDFSGLSARVTVYSISDDYSGEWMTNPMVPMEFKHEIEGSVHVGRHAIIGAGSIVLPSVNVGEGTAVGAMSLVTKNLEPWKIYWGVPCKIGKDRLKNILDLEQAFLKTIKNDSGTMSSAQVPKNRL